MRPGMVSRACVQPLVSADHACHVNQLIVHEGQIKSVARVLSSCGTLSHAGCYAACQVARHYHRCVIVRGPTQIRDGASGEGTPLLQSHPDPIASHRITFLMAAVGAGCRQFQTCCLYLLRYPPAPARPARHSLTTPSLPPPPSHCRQHSKAGRASQNKTPVLPHRRRCALMSVSLATRIVTHTIALSSSQPGATGRSETC